MYLHLTSKSAGILFYSERGWTPNTKIHFSFHGKNTVRAHTDKKIPEKCLRHATAIYKKHFVH